jgi:hypothetical protein
MQQDGSPLLNPLLKNPDPDQVQLGFVHTFFPPVVPELHHMESLIQQTKMGTLSKLTSPDLGHSDPGSSSVFSPSPMAIRCWAKYFSGLDNTLPRVAVPPQWVDFFTLLLLKQGSYEWAKEFLTSEA